MPLKQKKEPMKELSKRISKKVDTLSTEQKRLQITLAVQEEEMEFLKKVAKACHVSMTSYIKMALVESYIKNGFMKNNI